MNILFFVGSGISIPSGYPSISAITESLLFGEWYKHSNSVFYRGNQTSEYFAEQDLVPFLQAFLKDLYIYLSGYYSRYSRTPNYEDLFYFTEQLLNELESEIENPALSAFLPYIANRVKGLFPSGYPDGLRLSPWEKDSFEMGKDYGGITNLLENCCKFIKCVAWHSLTNQSLDIYGLDLIKDFALLNKVKKMDIVTLNHDLLLENLFQELNIPYFDCFGKPDENGHRYFDRKLFEINTKNFSLLKLHGSINWHLVRRSINNKAIDDYCILSKDTIIEGERLSILDKIPIFLCGSYNKESKYSVGIYTFIHNFFVRMLYEHNQIIMSGYGWNDRNINFYLLEWLQDDHTDRKIILLHENPEDLKKSRSGLWHKYDNLVMARKIIPIKKWLCNTSIGEIIEYVSH